MKSGRKLLPAVLAFFLLVLFPLWAWVIEPRLLLVRRITVTSPDLPDEFEGTRLAFITDLHHGPVLEADRVREVVEKVNSLDPDLVLLGGDYTSAGPKYIRPGIRPLAGLRAPLGKFAVLGNHDYWYSAAQTRAELAEAGIEDVENRGAWVRAPGAGRADGSPSARLRIAGVGDLWEGRQDLAVALADARPEDFVILLTHNPDYADMIPDWAADLVLAGHTHGGQVTLFGLWAPVLPIEGGQRLRSGVTRGGRATVVVSRGIGTIPPSVRFFCPPEIVLVTLARPGGRDR